MVNRILTFTVLFSVILCTESMYAQYGEPTFSGSGNISISDAIFPDTSYVHPNPALPGYPSHPHSPYIRATQPMHVPGSIDEMQSNVPYYQANGSIVERREPDTWWDPGAPIERMLKSAVTDTWFAIDGLHWSIQAPGTVLYGAPIANVRRPDLPFGIVDATGTPTGQTARVATTSRFDADDNNGIRATYGVPLTFGAFETSIFTLEEWNDTQVAQDLLDGDIDFIATSTYVNNQLDTNLEVYNTSYEASYDTDIWGYDAIVLFDTGSQVGYGIQLNPLVGLNILNVHERSVQRGSFTDPTDVVLNSSIAADTSNFLFGPALGARMAFKSRWFSLSLEPRATIGFNRFKTDVISTNFRSLGDGTWQSTTKRLTMSPVLEMRALLRIPVSKSLSFRCGYEAKWITQVARASNAVYYNDNGPLPNPPDIRSQGDTDEMFLHGFIFGGEFIFP